jgi:hypothetical protein
MICSVCVQTEDSVGLRWPRRGQLIRDKSSRAKPLHNVAGITGEPDASIASRSHGNLVIRDQSLSARKGSSFVLTNAIQSVGRAKPQISFPVFEG